MSDAIVLTINDCSDQIYVNYLHPNLYPDHSV